MKGKKLIFMLIIISLFISIFSSQEFNYDKFTEKSFFAEIKYFIVYFFNLLEQYTLYILFLLNVIKISEPYDFLFCFIAGCIFRILLLIFKNIYKSAFNLKDNYIYNEHDNTENLYKVINKLEEFKKNLSDVVNIKEEENNNNINNITNNNKINNNDLLKLTEIEKMNKNVNEKLEKIEECIKVIENNYNNEKTNNEKILKIILNCQQFIKNALESNQKEGKK